MYGDSSFPNSRQVNPLENYTGLKLFHSAGTFLRPTQKVAPCGP